MVNKIMRPLREYTFLIIVLEPCFGATNRTIASTLSTISLWHSIRMEQRLSFAVKSYKSSSGLSMATWACLIRKESWARSFTQLISLGSAFDLSKINNEQIELRYSSTLSPWCVNTLSYILCVFTKVSRVKLNSNFLQQ